MSIITAADRALTNDYETLEELKVRRRDGSLVRMKAQMILEEIALPDSARALQDPKLAQVDKERVKANLMKIAGIDNPAITGGAGQGFSIVINVGSGAPAPVAETRAPIDVTPRVGGEPAVNGDAGGGVTLTLPFARQFTDAHLINCDLSAGVDD